MADATIKIPISTYCGLLEKAIEQKVKMGAESMTTRAWRREIKAAKYFEGSLVEVSLYNMYGILKYADHKNFGKEPI